MSREQVLVSPDWVIENSGRSDVVLIEVDEDAAAYHQSHIENAIALDWRTDLQDPIRRDFVDGPAFSKLLSDKGIANEDTVVLYGGNNNWFAAYAYWYFKIYGHQDVRLLDGGRKRWELEGRPLIAEVTPRAATSYVAADPDASIRAWRDDVLAAIGTESIVDVRSPAEFSGEIKAPAAFPQEQPYIAGHVCRRPRTSRGHKRQPMTAPSSPTRISAPCTRAPA